MAEIDLKNSNWKTSYSVLALILISAALVFYIFFLIIPGYNSIEKIRQDIKTIDANLDVSQKIAPAFAKAKKIDKIKFEPSFLFPNRERLDRAMLPGLLNTFQTLALKHRVHLTDNRFDTNFLSNKSYTVTVYFEVEGRLQYFRDFLISMISLPFFETIETVNIYPGKNDVNNFTVNLKINVDPKHE